MNDRPYPPKPATEERQHPMHTPAVGPCRSCGAKKFPARIPQHAEPATGLTCKRLNPGS